MREIEKPFSLELAGKWIKVSEHELQGKRVFHIHFNDETKPLILAVGLNQRQEKFWTSIPQGRQKEGEQIGEINRGAYPC